MDILSEALYLEMKNNPEFKKWVQTTLPQEKDESIRLFRQRLDIQTVIKEKVLQL